jgi:hypothetical protein
MHSALMISSPTDSTLALHACVLNHVHSIWLCAVLCVVPTYNTALMSVTLRSLSSTLCTVTPQHAAWIVLSTVVMPAMLAFHICKLRYYNVS